MQPELLDQPGGAAHEVMERHRRLITTRLGQVSCIDTRGPGRAAIFVHGVGTNALIWRHVVAGLRGTTRCVAVDLPLHGMTPLRPGQEVSLPALADLVEAVCAKLDLGAVNLVANDTGGAVAQVLAARHPARLASLTLTNCEVHDNVPPRAFLPTVLAARLGLLAAIGPWLVANPGMARRRGYAAGYEKIAHLPLDVADSFIRPLLGTREAARGFQRWIPSIEQKDLVAVRPRLRVLRVPVHVVWGTGDSFFDVRWAHRLIETFPNSQPLVFVQGGRLFFPDERAEELVAVLRQRWAL